MRVYEAIVKGLESVGVEAAFGGAGENAAGLMLALKDSERWALPRFSTSPDGTIAGVVEMVEERLRS